MAAERALIIAAIIHNSFHAEGHPPAASMAPQRAKGSANTECSHLIISSETRTLCSVDIQFILTTAIRRKADNEQESFGKSFFANQRYEGTTIKTDVTNRVFFFPNQYQVLKLATANRQHHTPSDRELVDQRLWNLRSCS